MWRCGKVASKVQVMSQVNQYKSKSCLKSLSRVSQECTVNPVVNVKEHIVGDVTLGRNKQKILMLDFMLWCRRAYQIVPDATLLFFNYVTLYTTTLLFVSGLMMSALTKLCHNWAGIIIYYQMNSGLFLI